MHDTLHKLNDGLIWIKSNSDKDKLTSQSIHDVKYQFRTNN